MNQPIIMTPSDIAALVLGICGAIAVIGKAIEWIAKGISLIRKPEVSQNAQIAELSGRVDNLEKKIEQHDLFFASDNDKLEELLEGMRVLQRVNLATLSHAINGNDIDKLKEEEQELQEFLTKRR